MEKRREATILYGLSFAVTFTMFILLAVTLKLYPFSDNTILIHDNSKQFINFYNSFKHLITTNNNFIYTFSKNLGGDMVGFSAYYLQNPFMLILLLFPEKYMPEGLFIMEAVMLSCASMTFQILINKVYGRGSLIFSTAYGMMGYVMAYFTLPIYFTNIALLPIVILGLHKILNSEKSLLYPVTLALSIFFNYYIGYMLCLYLVLYFIYYCGCKSDTVKSFFGMICDKGKAFVLYSILGVMLSCFDLVPVALSLRNQKDAPGASIFKLSRTFRMTGLIRYMLPGKYNVDMSNMSLPYIYVGILPICGIVIFFISKKIKIFDKLAVAFLLGTLLVCLYIKPLNTIWHAFNEPVGFAHRFAFYLSFSMLIIGYRGYIEGDSFFADNKIVKKIKDDKVWKCVVGCALLFTLCELFYNAYHVLNVQIIESRQHSEYTEGYDRIGGVIDGIKSLETESDLYRIEKDFQYTMVDPMAFNYAGLSHNSSCEKDYVKSFMGKMGFRNQGIWAFYNQGSTAFADCFLSVKYFVSKFDTTDKPYEDVFNTVDGSMPENVINKHDLSSVDPTYVFRNPYALQFGSIADKEQIRSVDASGNNTFIFQNEIAKCYGINEDIFTEAKVSEIRVAGNVQLSDAFVNRADSNGAIINRLDNSEDSYAEFDVDIIEPGKTLYMYFAAPKMQGARLYVNGIDWDDYFSDWRWAVERVGTFKPDEAVTIRVEATGDGITLDDYMLYHEDYDVLRNWFESACNLGADSINLVKVSSSHIKGTFEAKTNGMLVFSIPYEKGWHIKIDGKRANTEEVLSALTGIEVSEGNHTIDMYYIPEGLVIGIAISIVALIVLVIIFKRKRT